MLMLPWLIAHTKRGDLRQRDAVQEASEEVRLERTPSACRHEGEVKVTARNFMGELRSVGHKQT